MSSRDRVWSLQNLKQYHDWYSGIKEKTIWSHQLWWGTARSVGARRAPPRWPGPGCCHRERGSWGQGRRSLRSCWSEPRWRRTGWLSRRSAGRRVDPAPSQQSSEFKSYSPKQAWRRWLTLKLNSECWFWMMCAIIRIMNQKLRFSCFSFNIFKPLSSKRLLMNGIWKFCIVNLLMIVTVGQVLRINDYNCQDCK